MQSQKDRRGLSPTRRFAPRVLLTLVLLFLTVPWWPGLSGRVAGFPAWAVYGFAAALTYAGIVAWLLQRHWDDGADEADP